MESGPSPFIPFIVLVTFGFILHGRSLTDSVAEAEITAFDFILVVSLFLVYSLFNLSISITVPVVLILVAYMASKVFMGPVVLILIIYTLSVFLPSYYQPYSHMRGTYNGRGGFQCEWGLVLLVFITLCLVGFISKGGEGNNIWGLVVVAVLLYLWCNLPS